MNNFDIKPFIINICMNIPNKLFMLIKHILSIAVVFSVACGGGDTQQKNDSVVNVAEPIVSFVSESDNHKKLKKGMYREGYSRYVSSSRNSISKLKVGKTLTFYDISGVLWEYEVTQISYPFDTYPSAKKISGYLNSDPNFIFFLSVFDDSVSGEFQTPNDDFALELDSLGYGYITLLKISSEDFFGEALDD